MRIGSFINASGRLAIAHDTDRGAIAVSMLVDIRDVAREPFRFEDRGDDDIHFARLHGHELPIERRILQDACFEGFWSACSVTVRRIRSADVISEFGRANPRASFVQVGSNDGTHLDPLREEIVARKWTGVMIEPVPYLFDRLRLSYSGAEGIRFLNAAISDHDGTQRLYYLPEDPDDSTLPPWYDTLASFRKDVILRHRKGDSRTSRSDWRL